MIVLSLLQFEISGQNQLLVDFLVLLHTLHIAFQNLHLEAAIFEGYKCTLLL